MPDVDVVVIGGGATGAGVLRDLAMRGLRAALVERADFGSGTSGRYHGLLHSGARYVVHDPESARDCARENAVIRRIAPACLELTGGYFVATPDDPLDYAERFVPACAAAGVEVDEVSPAALLDAEPLLNRRIWRAFSVADASLEPWELIDANLASARAHGAEAWRYTRLTRIVTGEDGAVAGVELEAGRTGERRTIACSAVVNAAGAWAGQVAALAGARLGMRPGKGAMLVMNRRLTSAVVNRLAPAGDGDILVPVHTVSILGTTDVEVADPDDVRVTDEEVRALLADGDRLVPGLSGSRVVRAYAGCRPLYDEADVDAAHESREISRAHHVVDHGQRDGIRGLWSIVGGKLTTYRLMAEQTVDAVAGALGVAAACRTADEVLPGSEEGRSYWLGERLAALEAEGGGDADLVCECEIITSRQLQAELDAHPDSTLDDLRRATRLGMGPCQGAFCTCRAAALLSDRQGMGLNGSATPDPNAALLAFLAERVRGTRAIAWGDQLAELWLEAGVYRGTLAVDTIGAAGNGSQDGAPSHAEP